MSLKAFSLIVATLLAPFFLFSQSDLLAMASPIELEQIASSKAPQSSMGERVVSINVKLYIESEVIVEIRDALGSMLFASEATYPEGDRQIKIGVGNMVQGLYFVRVKTDLDEISEMVIVERSP